jgi:hypothetical protein
LTTLLAERKVGGSRGQFPVVFEELDGGRVTAEISGVGAQDASLLLYRLKLEADLDTSAVVLPTLQPGDNTLLLTDDEDSSHRARVVLRWLEKPTADRIWEDFEGDFRWAGARQAEGSSSNGQAFTGERFAKFTFPANGRDHGFDRTFDPPLDLSAFNRMAIASRYRHPRGGELGAVLLFLFTEGGRYQFGLNPGAKWQYEVMDIGADPRAKVTRMWVYFLATPGYSSPATWSRPATRWDSAACCPSPKSAGYG